MLRTKPPVTSKTQAALPDLPKAEVPAAKASTAQVVGMGPVEGVPKAPSTPLSKVSQSVRAALGFSSQGGGRTSSPIGPVTAATIGAALVLSGCATTPAPGPGVSDRPAAFAPATATRTLESGVRVQLAPRTASPAAKYAHYAEIVEAFGGRIRPGEAYVLSLRGLDSRGTRDIDVHPYMRDTIVVLRNGANGPQVFEFSGSTYPGVQAPTQGPDVNGDGNRDVGMVREGNYRASSNGNFIGAPSYHVKRTNGSGRLPGVRDTNQDGTFSPEEWDTSVRSGHGLTAVLYHTGIEEGGSQPLVASRGCFNVYPIADFVAAVGGPGASFNTSVINATGPEPGGPVR